MNIDLDKVRQQEDALKGNINRMCVTHDIAELEKMRAWAIYRIEEIYRMNL